MQLLLLSEGSGCLRIDQVASNLEICPYYIQVLIYHCKIYCMQKLSYPYTSILEHAIYRVGDNNLPFYDLYVVGPSGNGKSSSLPSCQKSAYACTGRSLRFRVQTLLFFVILCDKYVLFYDHYSTDIHV